MKDYKQIYKLQKAWDKRISRSQSSSKPPEECLAIYVLDDNEQYAPAKLFGKDGAALKKRSLEILKRKNEEYEQYKITRAEYDKKTEKIKYALRYNSELAENHLRSIGVNPSRVLREMRPDDLRFIQAINPGGEMTLKTFLMEGYVRNSGTRGNRGGRGFYGLDLTNAQRSTAPLTEAGLDAFFNTQVWGSRNSDSTTEPARSPMAIAEERDFYNDAAMVVDPQTITLPEPEQASAEAVPVSPAVTPYEWFDETAELTERAALDLERARDRIRFLRENESNRRINEIQRIEDDTTNNTRTIYYRNGNLSVEPIRPQFAGTDLLPEIRNEILREDMEIPGLRRRSTGIFYCISVRDVGIFNNNPSNSFAGVSPLAELDVFNSPINRSRYVYWHGHLYQFSDQYSLEECRNFVAPLRTTPPPSPVVSQDFIAIFDRRSLYGVPHNETASAILRVFHSLPFPVEDPGPAPSPYFQGGLSVIFDFRNAKNKQHLRSDDTISVAVPIILKELRMTVSKWYSDNNRYLENRYINKSKDKSLLALL